VGVVAQW